MALKTKPDKEWKLSKSACEKWLSCPFSFKAYYYDRIKPIKSGSALVWGIAWDSVMNYVLECFIENKEQDPKEIKKIFFTAMDKTPLGKMNVGKYDYDKDVLSDKAKRKSLVKLKTYGYKGNDPDELVQKLLDKKKLSENETKMLDYMARLCFWKKSLLWLKQYNKQVLPKISKIHKVQYKTESGYLDAEAEFVKKKGLYIVDHKTSAMEYNDEQIDDHFQLVLYSAEMKSENVALIVFVKKLNKEYEKTCKSCGAKAAKGSRHQTCYEEVDGERCEGQYKTKVKFSVTIQEQYGKVSEMAKRVAKETRDEVKRGVDAGIFPCNFSKCNNQYGKPCEYRGLKWKGSMEGLEVYEKYKK